MEYLYLWLNIGSFIIPFLFSFHPKLQFHKQWKSLFPAIFIMMAFFISWDILFTEYGIWGFNEAYILGERIFNLPVEECLFFIFIPYACIFTQEALMLYFPKLKLSGKITAKVYFFLTAILAISLLIFYDRLYTAVNFIYVIILLGVVYNNKRGLLNSFFPTFLFILIPFFVINGILTGSWIAEPVVWYNDAQTIGLRMGTIPVEDVIYALGMLLTVTVLKDWFDGMVGKSESISGL